MANNHEEIIVTNGYWNESVVSALNDFNSAINSLYAINVGAFTGMGIPVEAEKYINENKIDFGEWADKLDMLRSIIFSEGINWNSIVKELKERK